MIASLLLALSLHAENRPWGLEEPAISPPSCANFLSEPNATNRVKLKIAWRRAEQKIDAIAHAVTMVEPALRAPMSEVARAARAAVTTHQRVFERENDLRKLDYQRHLAILAAIGNFDGKRPAWSLYQIERVIKTRHALREYADCVGD